MKKNVLFLVASALACASLVGCSKTSYDVTLSVWGGEEDQTFLKEVSDSFIEKVHAEEKAAGEKEKSFGFSFVAHSESNVKDDVTKDPNAAGDVIAIADDQLNDFVTAGDAQKISDIDADVASGVETRNSASSVAVSKINNELYAMPFTPNGFFLYYDSSVLSANDVADFDTLLNALVEKNKTSDIKYKFSWPTASGWYLGGYFDSFGLTAQINSSTSKTECNWNTKVTSGSIKATGLAASEAFMCSKGGESKSLSLAEAHINAAKEYIQNNYQFNLSVEDVAHNVGVTSNYLANIFAEHGNEEEVKKANELCKLRYKHIADRITDLGDDNEPITFRPYKKGEL